MIDRSNFREQFQYYDRELVVEVIDVFLKELPQRLADLRADTGLRDLGKLVQDAHSLKGMAGTFLATEAYEICGRLEEKAKKQDTGDIPELLSQLESVCSQVAADLTEIRAEYSR